MDCTGKKSIVFKIVKIVKYNQAKDIIARNRIFNTIGEVLPTQSQKPIVKLYKTVLTEGNWSKVL